MVNIVAVKSNAKKIFAVPERHEGIVQTVLSSCMDAISSRHGGETIYERLEISPAASPRKVVVIKYRCRVGMVKNHLVELYWKDLTEEARLEAEKKETWMTEWELVSKTTMVKPVTVVLKDEDDDRIVLPLREFLKLPK